MAVPDQEDLALDIFQAIMKNVELKRYLTPLRPRPTKVTAVTATPDVVVETLKDLQNAITQQAAEIQTLRQQKQTPALVAPPPTAAPGQLSPGPIDGFVSKFIGQPRDKTFSGQTKETRTSCLLPLWRHSSTNQQQ